jgi:DNA-binding transcriptional ArsR family regulator
LGGEAAAFVVFAVLAAPSHRRVVAALHEGPQTVRQIAERSGLTLAAVAAALAALRKAGLVEAAGAKAGSKRRRHRLVRTAFGAAVDALSVLADAGLEARDMGIEPSGRADPGDYAGPRWRSGRGRRSWVRGAVEDYLARHGEGTVRDMVDRIGAGDGAVREALARLEAEGLAEDDGAWGGRCGGARRFRAKRRHAAPPAFQA